MRGASEEETAGSSTEPLISSKEQRVSDERLRLA